MRIDTMPHVMAHSIMVRLMPPFWYATGFGFVTLADVDSCARAIAEMQGLNLDGRTISVEVRSQVTRVSRRL